MARNRYGWQKRAKELARKQKNDDKMKRRQGKTPGPQAEVIPAVEAGPLAGGAAADPTGPHFPADPSLPD